VIWHKTPKGERRAKRLLRRLTYKNIEEITNALNPESGAGVNANLQMLRVCANTKMNHLVRGLPLRMTEPFTKLFDEAMLDLCFRILGVDSDLQVMKERSLVRKKRERLNHRMMLVNDQVRAPLRFGGMGLTSVTDTAPFARLGALLQMSRVPKADQLGDFDPEIKDLTSKVRQLIPDQKPLEHVLPADEDIQEHGLDSFFPMGKKFGGGQYDARIQKKLSGAMANYRDQRLARDCPKEHQRRQAFRMAHAGTGYHLLEMPDGATRTMGRRRLGLAPAKRSTTIRLEDRCPLCKKKWKDLKSGPTKFDEETCDLMDPNIRLWHLGDCRQYSQNNRRHEEVKGTLFHNLQSITSNVQAEPAWTGDEKKKTRADLRVRLHGVDHTHMLDVSVVNPECGSRPLSNQPFHLLLKYKEDQKNAYYRQANLANARTHTFVPFIIATQGGFGQLALAWLKDVCRYIEEEDLKWVDSRRWYQQVVKSVTLGIHKARPTVP
jgi:hypothetical protein